MRLTIIWIVLLAATAANFTIGDEVRVGRTETAIILAIAFIKARIVMQEFMEIRLAPHILGIATDSWAILMWAMLTAIPWLVAA